MMNLAKRLDASAFGQRQQAEPSSDGRQSWGRNFHSAAKGSNRLWDAPVASHSPGHHPSEVRVKSVALAAACRPPSTVTVLHLCPPQVGPGQGICGLKFGCPIQGSRDSAILPETARATARLIQCPALRGTAASPLPPFLRLWGNLPNESRRLQTLKCNQAASPVGFREKGEDRATV